jgi:tetratricopeptide (TPR) repeat protein
MKFPLPLQYGKAKALLWSPAVIPLLAALLAAAPAADVSAVLQESRTLTLAGRWDDALAALSAAQKKSASEPRAAAALATERGRVLADSNFFRKFDPAGARAALEDALKLARAAGDAQSEADARQYLGQLVYAEAFETKDWKTPRATFQALVPVREKLGDRRGLSATYFYLGLTYEQDGQPDPAMENYTKSLAISEEVGDLVMQSYARRHIGGIQEERGELAVAEKNIAAEIDLRKRGGFLVGIPFALRQQADFVAAHGAGKKEAMKVLEDAIATAQKCGSTRGLYLSRLDLSRLARETGDLRRADALALAGLEGARAFGSASAIKQAEEQVAEVRKALQEKPAGSP